MFEELETARATVPPATPDAVLAGIAARLDLVAQGADVSSNLAGALQAIMNAAETNMTDASPEAIDQVVLGLMCALQPLVDSLGKTVPTRDAEYALRCAAEITRLFGHLPEDLTVDPDAHGNMFDSVAIVVAEIAIALRLERMRERTLRRGWGGPSSAGATIH